MPCLRNFRLSTDAAVTSAVASTFGQVLADAPWRCRRRTDRTRRPCRRSRSTAGARRRMGSRIRHRPRPRGPRRWPPAWTSASSRHQVPRIVDQPGTLTSRTGDGGDRRRDAHLPADAQSGEQRRRLQQRDRDERLSKTTGIEHGAEHERRQCLPRVQTGVDEPVHPTERAAAEAARRRATHQQVAAGPGEADAESDADHQRPQRRPASSPREHGGHDRGESERRCHHSIGTILQKTSRQHSGAAAHEVRREPAARDDERHAVDVTQDCRRVVLQNAERHGRQEEEGERQPHGPGCQKRKHPADGVPRRRAGDGDQVVRTSASARDAARAS